MFFFKQKTAYEMRISDWSSDVCSSDLVVIQDLVVALSLAAVPVHRVIETRGRSVLEMHRLAGKRAETRGDEQEPGEQFRPVFQIGRAHVWTPVTNAHPVCCLLIEQSQAQYELSITYSQS